MAACFVVFCVAASTGCVSSEPQQEVWVDPVTEVTTFDAEGRPTSGRALGELIWGLDPERTARAERQLQEAPTDPGGASGPLATDAPPHDPARRRQGLAGEPGAAAQDPVPKATESPESADPQDPQSPDDAQDPRSPGDPQDPQGEDERRREEARLRILFGSDVMIRPDGRVTKQYFLSADAGAVFLNLLAPIKERPKPGEFQVDPDTPFGGAQQDSVLGQMLGADHEVEIVYLADFEQGYNMPPRPTPTKQTQPNPAVPIRNSLLLVTAKPSALLAFERALNLFYASIPQVEIEVKVVEYTTTDTINFGVIPVDANTPTLNNLSSGKLIQDITSDFPLTAPFIGATDITTQGLISLGGIHDNWELNAVLQALETNNIADVKSQPKMVVRNGGLATVSTRTSQPFPKAKITNQTVTSTDIDFKEVGIVMDIRPEIAGTDTVILNVYASVSAVTGFAATDPIPTPIIATREAATSVHLKVGESTVIGGLVSESLLETESKVPILGDIPILGYLFRNSSSSKQKTTLEFWITPKILRGTRGAEGGEGF